jgi:hypothetical protein
MSVETEHPVSIQRRCVNYKLRNGREFSAERRVDPGAFDPDQGRPLPT